MESAPAAQPTSPKTRCVRSAIKLSQERLQPWSLLLRRPQTRTLSIFAPAGSWGSGRPPSCRAAAPGDHSSPWLLICASAPQAGGPVSPARAFRALFPSQVTSPWKTRVPTRASLSILCWETSLLPVASWASLGLPGHTLGPRSRTLTPSSLPSQPPQLPSQVHVFAITEGPRVGCLGTEHAPSLGSGRRWPAHS